METRNLLWSWVNKPVADFESTLPEEMKNGASVLSWPDEKIGQGVLAMMKSVQKKFSADQEVLSARAFGICMETLGKRSAFLTADIEFEIMAADMEKPGASSQSKAEIEAKMPEKGYFHCEVILSSEKLTLPEEADEADLNIVGWANVMSVFYSPEFWGSWVRQLAHQVEDADGQDSISLLALLATGLWATEDFHIKPKASLSVRCFARKNEESVPLGEIIVRRTISREPFKPVIHG